MSFQTRSSRKTRKRSLRLEALEGRRLLATMGAMDAMGVEVTADAIVTPHDTYPRFGANPTHSALADGDWSDASTWSSGEVPGEDAVVNIPAGVAVVYDLDSQQELDVVEVSGHLAFDSDVDTSLWLNELVVLPSGTLTVGSVEQPIAAEASAEIVFTDTPGAGGHHFKTGTAENVGIDPSQYGNGLLVFGSVTMHGRPLEQTFTRLAVEAQAGDRQIVLDTANSGWQIGDQLVFPDTRQINPVDVAGRYSYSPQYETRSILAIDGDTITLDEPLQHDHVGPRDADGTKTVDFAGEVVAPHVGNLTRNVVLRSENPDGVRGHTMFIGAASRDIRYVSFEELGRTTVGGIDNTRYDSEGNVVDIGTNQISRYPDHLHHLRGPQGGIAVESGGETYQWISIGNSVTGSLKWGTTIHGSHYGLLRDNVYYDTDGAAVVTEDGSEFGNLIQHNFVVRVNGGGGAVNEMGLNIHDRGDLGDGFWFAGPMNQIEDNVVANAYRNGYVVYTENVSFSGNSRTRNVQVPLFPGANPHHAGQTRTVNIMSEPLDHFQRNEVYGATTAAIWLWSVGDRRDGNLEDGRNTITDMVAWHIAGLGAFFYYANDHVIDGWIHRSDPAMMGAGRYSGGTEDVYAVFTHGGSIAATSDIYRADVQGAPLGYLNRGRGLSDTITINDSYFDNRTNIVNAPWAQNPSDGVRDFVLRNVQFGNHFRPGANHNVEMRFLPPSVEAGVTPETTTIFDFGGFEGIDLDVYYEQQSPAATITDELDSPAAGLSNQEGFEQFGVANGGRVAPTFLHDGDAGVTAFYRGLALGITGLVFERNPQTPPQLFANVYNQGGEAILHYAVLGDTSGVSTVAFTVEGRQYRVEPRPGRITLHSLKGATGDVELRGQLLDAQNVPLAAGHWDSPVRLPVQANPVRTANRSPVFVPIHPVQTVANQEVAFTVQWNDSDGEVTSVDVNGLPAGATFDASSGVFRWTPSNHEVGDHTIEFIARDNWHATSSLKVDVGVAFDATTDPVVVDLDFTQGEAIDQSSYANDGIVQGPTGKPNIGLSFDGRGDRVVIPSSPILQPADGIGIDVLVAPAGQGALTEFVNFNSGSYSAYALQVKAGGANSSQGYYFTVTTDKGRTTVFAPKSTWDRQMDQVSARFDATVDGGRVELFINGVRGASKTGVGSQIVYKPYGTQNVSIGGATDTGNTFGGEIGEVRITAGPGQSIPVEVANRRPVIESIDPVTVLVGEPVAFRVQWQDPDGDEATVSATTLPAGATFDPVTGAFQWVPSSQDVGRHEIAFIARDARGATGTTSVSVTVSLEADTRLVVGDYRFSRGDAVDQSSYAHDGIVRGPIFEPHVGLHFDGSGDRVLLPRSQALKPVDGIGIQVAVAPDGDSALSDIVTFNSGSWSAYALQVKASGYQGKQGYYFTVTTDQGRTTVFAPQSTWDGQMDQLSARFDATVEGGRVELYVNGVLRTSKTGVGSHVVYKPYGTQEVTIGGASDSSNTFGGTIGRVTLTAGPGSSEPVEEPNRQPVLNTIDPIQAIVNDKITFTVRAADPDGDGTTLSATALPPNATFDVDTGVFQWSPSAEHVGDHQVRFVARDEHGGSSSMVVSIHVASDAALDSVLVDLDFTLGHASDQSGRGNDGIVQGPLFDPSEGLRFEDPGDRVILASSNALRPAEGITIEAAVAADARGGLTDVVTYNSGSWSAYALQVKANGYRGKQGYYFTVTTDHGRSTLFAPQSTWDGQVDQITARFDATVEGGRAELYVNGVLMASRSGLGNRIVYKPYSTQEVSIGGAIDSTNTFRGTIERVRLSAGA